MTLAQMSLFATAVSGVKNLDTIRMINAVSYPHMKQQDQKHLIRSLSGETGLTVL